MDKNARAFFEEFAELLEKHKVDTFGPTHNISGGFTVYFEDKPCYYTCNWASNYYDMETDECRPGIQFAEHSTEKLFFQRDKGA